MVTRHDSGAEYTLRTEARGSCARGRRLRRACDHETMDRAPIEHHKAAILASLRIAGELFETVSRPARLPGICRRSATKSAGLPPQSVAVSLRQLPTTFGAIGAAVACRGLYIDRDMTFRQLSRGCFSVSLCGFFLFIGKQRRNAEVERHLQRVTAEETASASRRCDPRGDSLRKTAFSQERRADSPS